MPQYGTLKGELPPGKVTRIGNIGYLACTNCGVKAEHHLTLYKRQPRLFDPTPIEGLAEGGEPISFPFCTRCIADLRDTITEGADLLGG